MQRKYEEEDERDTFFHILNVIPIWFHSEIKLFFDRKDKENFSLTWIKPFREESSEYLANLQKIVQSDTLKNTLHYIHIYICSCISRGFSVQCA